MLEPPLPDMNSTSDHPSNGGKKGVRPPYRPPVGVPVPKQNQLGGRVATAVIYLLLIALILAPATSPELRREIFGAGGEGPAGGGGGGSRGAGGGVPKTERMQFVQVTPPPPKPVPVPQVKPPEVKPIVPPPPVVPPQPAPKPVEQKVETKSDKPPADVPGPVTGTGGGTGNDGSNGTGPGAGGGVGAGVGTGKGSAVGPGTGGGPGTIYPPQPTVMFIPPIPAPSKLKGKEMIAEFDVDSTGKVIDIQVASTRDGAYDKKLRESLAGVKFRPAVNGYGQPVRAKTQIIYTF